MTCLNLLTWNCTGIMSSSLYLGEILKGRDIDVCGISETWLYPWDGHFIDTIHTDYTGLCNFATIPDVNITSRHPVRKGGVALMWKRVLDKVSKF